MKKYRLLGLPISLGASFLPLSLTLACNDEVNVTQNDGSLQSLKSTLEGLTTTSLSSNDFVNLNYQTAVKFDSAILGINVTIPATITVAFTKQPNSKVVNYSLSEGTSEPTSFSVTFKASIADEKQLSELETYVKTQKSTSLSGVTFKASQFDKTKLSVANANSLLGISLPDKLLANNLNILVTKAPNQLDVTYLLSFDNSLGSSKLVSTTFEQSTSEIARLAMLENFFKPSTTTSLSSEVLYALSLAQFAITPANIESALGIIWPSDVNDSNLQVLVTKSANSFELDYDLQFTQSFAAKQIFKVTLDHSSFDDDQILVTKNYLQTIEQSTLTERVFRALEFSTWVSLESAKSSLGINSLSLPNHSLVNFTKASDSVSLVLEVAFGLGHTERFTLNVRRFAASEAIGLLETTLSHLQTTSLASQTFYQNSLNLVDWNDASVTSTLGISFNFNALSNEIASLKVSKLANSEIISYQTVDKSNNVASLQVTLNDSASDINTLANAAEDLKLINSTSLANFYKTVFNYEQLSKSDFATNLGISTTSLPEDLQFKVTKVQNSASLTLQLAFGRWNKGAPFNIDITSSTGDQALLNELGDKLRLITTSELSSNAYFNTLSIATSDAPIALDFSALGVLLTHDHVAAIINDPHQILVKFYKEAGQNVVNYVLQTYGALATKTVVVTFNTFGLDQAKETLVNLKTSTISEQGFKALVFTNAPVTSDVLTKLGITLATPLNSDVIFKITKVQDSPDLTFSFSSVFQIASLDLINTFDHFNTLDFSATETALKALLDSSKTNSTFSNLTQTRTVLTNAIGVNLGVDYQTILSNLASRLDIHIQKSQGTTIKYTLVERLPQVDLLNFEVTFNDFFDGSLPTTVRINGALNLKIGISHFQALSDATTLTSKAQALQTILSFVYEASTNPFVNADLTDISVDATTWATYNGSYELTFKGTKEGQTKDISLQATNILSHVLESVLTTTFSAGDQEKFNFVRKTTNGQIYLLTSEVGKVYQQANDGTFALLANLPQQLINDIFVDNQGLVYLATNATTTTSGIYKQVNNQFELVVTNVPTGHVNQLLANNDGKIYAATQSGLFVSQNDGTFSQSSVINQQYALGKGSLLLTSRNFVYAFSVDYEESETSIDQDNQAFIIGIPFFSEAIELSNGDVVASTTPTPAYLAGSILKFEATSNSLEHSFLSFVAPNGEDVSSYGYAGAMSNFFIDSQNNIWGIGKTYHNLVAFKNFQFYDRKEIQSGGNLPSEKVYGMFENQQNKLFFMAFNGVYEFSDSREIRQFAANSQSNSVYDMFTGLDNKTYAVTNQGIFEFKARAL